MSLLEREAFQVLVKLRRRLRGDNRRLASANLRLTKGPIVDWLLEQGFLEERVSVIPKSVLIPEDDAAPLSWNCRREPLLFVTASGDAFWAQFNRPRRTD